MMVPCLLHIGRLAEGWGIGVKSVVIAAEF
jgi:hypothetical protein